MEGLKLVIAVTVAFSHMASFCYAMPTFIEASMPSNCTDKTFCFDKHPDYPEKLIESMLADTGDYFDDNDQPIGHRSRSETPPNECEAIRRIDPIYHIVDENGRTRFVVQSKKRFMQVVRIEECVNPGSLRRSTRNLSFEQVKMNNLVCVDKMMDYKFVVLSLDGQSMEAVRVQGGLPVCCSCQTQDD